MDMKKYVELWAIVCIALCVSCKKEIVLQEDNDDKVRPLVEFVIHASKETIPDEVTSTKTELQPDGAIFWSPSDSISLFFGPASDGGYPMVSNNNESTSSTDFVGKVDKNDYETLWAVYPYQKDNSFDGEELVVHLPFHQVAKEDGFADDLFVSVAKSSDNNMTFFNVCGGVKFSVSQEGITQVSLSTGYKVPLAGELHILTDEACNPRISSIDDSSSTIYVDAPDGGCFEVGKWYYIVTAPISDNVISLTYLKGIDKATYSTAAEHKIKRACFGKLDCKDRDLEFNPCIAKLQIWDLRDYRSASIERIDFHTLSSETNGQFIGADTFGDPIYLDVHDNALDFYTVAPAFGITEGQGRGFFSQYPSVEKYDLSKFDFRSVQDASQMFYGCSSLKSLILGTNSNLISDMSEMFYGCAELESVDFSHWNLSNVENMSAMFEGCSNLKSVIWDASIKTQIKITSRLFLGCTVLENLELSSFNTANCEDMENMFSDCSSLSSLDLSSFDTSNCTNMHSMFAGCSRLKTLNASFNLQSATDIGWMFYNCASLESISFTQDETPQLQKLDLFLCQCRNIKVLDLGGVKPTSESAWASVFAQVAGNRRQFAIVAPTDVREAILSNNLGTYHWYPDRVVWVLPGEGIPEMSDETIPDTYYSSDYSLDDTIVQIQRATQGKGIDLYFMGDAYSDRLIKDGTYESDIRLAIEAIFEKEPFRSYRDYFNLNMIYCVSANEHLKFKYTDSDPYYLTKFNTLLIDGSTGVEEDYNPVDYIKRLIPEISSSIDITAIVILNEKTGKGAAGMDFSYTSSDGEYTDLEYNGFGNGNARMYVSRLEDDDQFKRCVLHEFGHAFAKLKDEYWYSDESEYSATEYDIDSYNAYHAHGWALNVSLSNDSTAVPWAKYIVDSRYANSGVGMFEGGLLNAKGVWRATETSVMRDQSVDDEFNVIARQSIYNRINKLAFGNQWQFDYETFVQQDLKNTKPTAKTLGKSALCTKDINVLPIFKKTESISSDGTRVITIFVN